MLQRLMGVAALVSVAGWASADPVILNGDFNGTIGADTAPDDWAVAQGTPDVCDETGPFNNTGHPWNLSPNGGTFVRGNGTSDERSEAIVQTVSGFTAGATYAFDFFQTNLGFTGNPAGVLIGTSGHWQFYLDGSLVAESEAVARPADNASPIVWHAASVTFIAPAESFELTIMAERLSTTGDFSYLGIDGLSARLVPGPGTMAVLAAAGLLSLSRRRT